MVMFWEVYIPGDLELSEQIKVEDANSISSMILVTAMATQNTFLFSLIKYIDALYIFY